MITAVAIIRTYSRTPSPVHFRGVDKPNLLLVTGIAIGGCVQLPPGGIRAGGEVLFSFL
jgi:hypothetical protein